MKAISVILTLMLVLGKGYAQINESPAGVYQWKRGKTEPQQGYVVLKSGKRMEGKISLIGSADYVTEVAYEGDGKELKFPVASLKSYGLTNVSSNASATSGGGPVNESPESMYEWLNMSVVMNKVIESTRPRNGYVVHRNGTKYEGELKLRRKDGVLEDISITTVSGKEKFDAKEIARYGLTVSEAEVVQAKLAREQNSKRSFPGSIITAAGKTNGEVTLMRDQGVRNFDRIIFKNAGGTLQEYTSTTITGFTYVNKGVETKYTVIENVFVPEGFNGNTFQLYRNPNPTTINERATALVKGAVAVGTSAAATAVVKADAKRNDYETNMDSVIRVSSTEDLIALRDQWAQLAGYQTAEEALENSDNESLKANLGAMELAIQGRQATSSPGGILNVEWVIFNKITNEKTIVYKNDYKDQIEILLMGCDKYLELARPMQNDMQKWDNLEKTVKFLDGCY